MLSCDNIKTLVVVVGKVLLLQFACWRILIYAICLILTLNITWLIYILLRLNTCKTYLTYCITIWPTLDILNDEKCISTDCLHVLYDYNSNIWYVIRIYTYSFLYVKHSKRREQTYPITGRSNISYQMLLSWMTRKKIKRPLGSKTRKFAAGKVIINDGSDQRLLLVIMYMLLLFLIICKQSDTYVYARF